MFPFQFFPFTFQFSPFNFQFSIFNFHVDSDIVLCDGLDGGIDDFDRVYLHAGNPSGINQVVDSTAARHRYEVHRVRMPDIERVVLFVPKDTVYGQVRVGMQRQQHARNGIAVVIQHRIVADALHRDRVPSLELRRLAERIDIQSVQHDSGSHIDRLPAAGVRLTCRQQANQHPYPYYPFNFQFSPFPFNLYIT